jgi:hypothetical protein
MTNIYRVLLILFSILYIPAYFLTYADLLSFMNDQPAKNFIYNFINYSFLIILASLFVLSLLPEKKPETLTLRERQEIKSTRLNKKIGDRDDYRSVSTKNDSSAFSFLLTSGSNETGSSDSYESSSGGDCGGE